MVQSFCKFIIALFKVEVYLAKSFYTKKSNYGEFFYIGKYVYFHLSSRLWGKPSYLVEATYTDGRRQRKEWVDDLRNLDLFGIYEINDSFLPAESRRLLLSKLMYEASRLPGRMIFDSYEGLQTVCGVPVYVAGEHIFCFGELPAAYEVATRNTMQPVRYEDRKEILKLCRPYFGLLPGTSEILFMVLFLR